MRNKNAQRSYDTRRTKHGLIYKIYNNQKLSSIRRNHPLPNYTFYELEEWIIKQELFDSMYTTWVDSEYSRNLVPSIDRKDDYLPYTLDNIQLMTWIENNKKGSRDRKCGINNKMSKSVFQLSMTGDLIEEYYSVNEASRQTGISDSDIVQVCNGKPRRKGYYKSGEIRYSIPLSAGGFKWKYKNNDINHL